MTAMAAKFAGKVAYHPITGFRPWQPPAPQVFHEPRIPDRKPSKLARRHAVLSKISLDPVQKLHRCSTHFGLVFMLCSV